MIYLFFYLFNTIYCFKFKFNRGDNYIETVITFKFKVPASTRSMKKTPLENKKKKKKKKITKMKDKKKT